MARALDGRERGEQGCNAWRNPQEADLDLRDRAQRSLRADQHSTQVESDPLWRIAADPVDAAIREHDLHAEHVVGGNPVVEAMRAARVLGRVAADGAGFLTGRVGPIEESVRSRHERELLVYHAGLNHR